MENYQRNLQIFKMRHEGYTYRAIAKHFGITFQRVEQIINAKRPRKKLPDLITIRFDGVEKTLRTRY